MFGSEDWRRSGLSDEDWFRTTCNVVKELLSHRSTWFKADQGVQRSIANRIDARAKSVVSADFFWCRLRLAERRILGKTRQTAQTEISQRARPKSMPPEKTGNIWRTNRSCIRADFIV